MKISDYYDGSDVITADNGSADYFRISPSSAGNFFAFPRQWYGENLLGEPGFEGSDSTTLGTIIHFLAEQASLGKPIEDPTSIVAEYLDSQPCLERETIEELYPQMADVLITEYVQKQRPPTLTEHFMFHKLLPGVYVAGTTDRVQDLGNGSYSVVDYKTAATKPSGISYNYRVQAHIYAFLLTKAGYPITQIELQYAVRPTKTLPARHVSFIEPFTSIDLDKITGQLQLIAESVDTWKKQPDLRYLLAQDYRLKTPQKVKPLFLRA